MAKNTQNEPHKVPRSNFNNLDLPISMMWRHQILRAQAEVAKRLETFKTDLTAEIGKRDSTLKDLEKKGATLTAQLERRGIALREAQTRLADAEDKVNSLATELKKSQNELLQLRDESQNDKAFLKDIQEKIKGFPGDGGVVPEMGLQDLVDKLKKLESRLQEETFKKASRKGESRGDARRIRAKRFHGPEPISHASDLLNELDCEELETNDTHQQAAISHNLTDTDSDLDLDENVPTMSYAGHFARGRSPQEDSMAMLPEPALTRSVLAAGGKRKHCGSENTLDRPSDSPRRRSNPHLPTPAWLFSSQKASGRPDLRNGAKRNTGTFVGRRTRRNEGAPTPSQVKPPSTIKPKANTGANEAVQKRQKSKEKLGPPPPIKIVYSPGSMPLEPCSDDF